MGTQTYKCRKCKTTMEVRIAQELEDKTIYGECPFGCECYKEEDEE